MKTKQRVLSLDPAGLLWGSERALLDFIGEIPEFESACCCPPGSPLIEKLKARNVACLPTFQANLHLRGVGARLLALWGLLRALWIYRPGVLHVNQAGATRIALLACRLFRIPCVVHVRLQEDVEYLNRLRPSPKYLRCLFAVSQPIADLIKAQPNLQNIPCATLLDAYLPKFASGGRAVSNSHQQSKWDFVCIGRISPSKGQEILIRALHLLQQSGQSPRVVFVGEINDCGRGLQRLVKDLELEAAVEFAGHLDNVFDVLANGRWLVCPSKYESLGRVVFEAWDTGLPVIAGQFSGGVAASVHASNGGLLFEEWSPESLATTLRCAMSIDSAAGQEMAQKGRTWLVQTTHPTRYAKAIADTFQQAIRSFEHRANLQ